MKLSNFRRTIKVLSNPLLALVKGELTGTVLDALSV